MTMTDTRVLTADDLLSLHGEGVRGELIQGVLHKTMASGVRHGKIVVRLVSALFDHSEPKGLGTLVASDSGVLLERDPDTVREPDIAFTSAEKMPLGADITGYAEVVPDLVIEIRSPSEGRRVVYDKACMWISHGVRLVWVIHPDTRTVDVHRPGSPVATLAGDDTIDGGDILPGFTCALATVFDQHPPSRRPSTGRPPEQPATS